MNVIKHNDSGVELEVNGEILRGVRRIDRYTKPGKWRRPMEEVEIWCLEDGRQVRISRMGSQQARTARWR